MEGNGELFSVAKWKLPVNLLQEPATLVVDWTICAAIRGNFAKIRGKAYVDENNSLHESFNKGEARHLVPPKQVYFRLTTKTHSTFIILRPKDESQNGGPQVKHGLGGVKEASFYPATSGRSELCGLGVVAALSEVAGLLWVARFSSSGGKAANDFAVYGHGP
jgi:hypothetical protein